MNKATKTIILCALMMASPLAMMAEDMYDGPETETSAVMLSTNGKVARVCNADGETLEVYNLAGIKIASYRIDSADKTLNLKLPKGCYILKVGNVVRKVSVN